MSILTLVFGIFALAVGSIIFWANPERRLNQILFATALVQFLWLSCLYAAMHAGLEGDLYKVAYWLKFNAVISAFFPVGIWLTNELATNIAERANVFRRSLPWLATGLALASLTTRDSFLIHRFETERFSRGLAYLIYQLIAVPSYILLIFNTISEIRQFQGLKRIEIQFFPLSLAIAALVAAILTAVGNLIDSSPVKRSSIAVIFLLYITTSWFIATYKLFNLKRALTLITQRACLVAILSVGIIFSTSTLNIYIHTIPANITSVVAFASLVFILDRKLIAYFDLDGTRQLTKARNAVMDIGRRETDLPELIINFSILLKKEFHTDHIALQFYSNSGEHALESFPFTKQQISYKALCEIGWATPESLEKRSKDAALRTLYGILVKCNIGVVAISPSGGHAPSLVVALGQKEHFWPFTYHEIQRLQNLVDLIDGILVRARLASQVSVQSKVEHLEMMSRGLAHDLRNLITPITSFLSSTDFSFCKGSPEAEVCSAAKQSAEVMDSYIREALFFARQLTPNFCSILLINLLRSVKDLTAFQANKFGVTISVSCADRIPDKIQGDFTLLQRLVVNLVRNAIDASIDGQSVKISLKQSTSSSVSLSVVDEGTGISSDDIDKIFDPYFTTKNRGDDTRGFGLGLTICRKIAELHRGSISVESALRKGTSITVDLPINPELNKPKDISKETLI